MLRASTVRNFAELEVTAMKNLLFYVKDLYGCPLGLFFFSVKYKISFQNQSLILETKALFNLETKGGRDNADTYLEPCDTSKFL